MISCSQVHYDDATHFDSVTLKSERVKQWAGRFLHTLDWESAHTVIKGHVRIRGEETNARWFNALLSNRWAVHITTASSRNSLIVLDQAQWSFN